MAGYYNPYADFAKIKDYNFNIDNQGIMDRFNERITRETAARQPQQQSGAQLNPGMFMGAIGQLGSSLANRSSNPYDFNTNSAAPLVGAAQGFATGGPVGAVIGGVAGVINRRESYKQASNNVKNINGSVDLSGVDPITGKPTFNSGAAIEATTTIDSLNNSNKKRRKGLFRTGDDLALAHGMQLKANELSGGLQTGRDEFNSSMRNYNAQQQAMTQYNQLLNNQNRLRSLYSIGTQLY